LNNTQPFTKLAALPPTPPRPARSQGLRQQQGGAARGSAGVRCTHHHLFWQQLAAGSSLVASSWAHSPC